MTDSRFLHEKIKMQFRWLTARIKSGPLKGMRWIAASGMNFIRGRYEEFKTNAVIESVKPGDVVYDIGGHVGYYSILFTKLVGSDGQVIVFEPRPLNIAYIRRHISLNKISNIRLIEAAVSNSSGEARFDDSTGTGTGHLSSDGKLIVREVVLDDLIDGNEWPYPDYLKMDIEGGEINALKGARRSIEHARPRMLLATHGDETHQFVTGFLDELAYRYEVLNPNATKGDTEIIAWPSAQE